MDATIKILAVGCFVILLFFSFGCTEPDVPGGNSTNITQEMKDLKKFNSSAELKAFLDEKTVSSTYGVYDFIGGVMVTPMMQATGTMAKSSEASAPDYSQTNVQVAGVDEPDFVKTDGKYLYVVAGNKLIIAKAYPAENARVVSETVINGNPRELFINNDDLVLFSGNGWSETTVLQYDVSDRSEPLLRENITVDGSYFDSRMIGKYVYVVANKPANCYDECEPNPPVIQSHGKNLSGGFPDVYYFDEPANQFSFTTVISIDLKDEGSEPSYKIFLNGAAGNMYVSSENIYLAYARIPDYVLTEGNPIRAVAEKILPMPIPVYKEETGIRRISIEDGKIEYAASGFVPGHILNQFSMDEHDGYFRIATTIGQVAQMAEYATSKNNVYVLDNDLNTKGKLENLAPGEKIYSARFMGDRAYLVTFRKVDPLFVIDLENPEKPKVLGKLKIPGYSDYLHPYDETHLIGLGKDAIPSEEGDFSWYQGLKLSLFDVSDVENPKEVANYKIGDRGTDSYALQDHKAFLFSKERNLLVIPVTLAEIDESKYASKVDPWQHGDYVFQGAYVFDISAEDGFRLKGRVTHQENRDEMMKSGYYYYNSPYDIRRSLYIEDVLYTISEGAIKMNGLENLEEINEISLN